MFTAVFGAGASYDADPDQPKRDPWRPPLTEELVAARASFAEALGLYQPTVPLIARLRNLPAGSSLEDQLESLAAELDYEAGQQQIAALRFYLRHVTWYCGQAMLARTRGVTNYATVLAIVDAWLHHTKERACLLTFNYDPLLDDAVMRSLRIDLRSIDSFIGGRSDVIYTKLHGSADWRRVVEQKPRPHTSASAVALIGAAGRLRFTSEYLVLPVDARKKRPWSEDFRIRDTEEPNTAERITFPELALPLRTKSTFACPPAHLEAVLGALGETSKLLVVGWRAREQHFMTEWGRVRNKPVRADIVCGSAAGAEAVVNQLRSIGLGGDLRTFGKGFTDYVRSNALRSLLDA